MKQTLKRQSLRRLLPWILILAIAGAVLLGLTGKGLFLLLRGPKALSAQDPEDLKGQYVSFDASEVIVAFANLTSTSDDGSTTLKTYYLLPAGDGTYLAVMDKKEAHGDVLDQAMTQSYDYYMGDGTKPKELGTLQGAVGELEEDMTDYMVECIEKYALPGYAEGGDTAALVRPMQINLDKIGLLSGTLTLALGGLGLVFLLAAIALLVLIFSGAFQKKAFSEMSCGQEEADRLFSQAEQLERVWAGEYILYQKGAFTKVLPTAELIWGYAEPEPLVVSKYRWPVALFDATGKKTLLCFMDKKNREKLLAAVTAQGHPFVSGYSPEYARKFAEDRKGFLEMAGVSAEEAERLLSEEEL